MKKIIKIMLFIILFLCTSKNVYAITNNLALGDKIDGLLLYEKTEEKSIYKYMYQITNVTTGELIYCVEPGVPLYIGSYTVYNSTVASILNGEQWDYVNTIAYYGYGYNDRTDLKWYVVTQYLIWDYLLQDKGEIYFVNSNREKIELYKDEMAELLKDVEHHYILPSFAEAENYSVRQTSKIGDTITLVDENNVLDEYNILTTYPDETDIEINGNVLTVTFHHEAENYLMFQRKMDDLGLPDFYYKEGYQSAISRGVYHPTFGNYLVYVENPTITIEKTDSETTNPIEGVKYGLYDFNNTLIYTFITDEFGLSTLSNVSQGTYTLKELEAPYGYKINDEEITIEVYEDDITLKLTNDLIKKEILLIKYLETSDNKLIIEDNATFEIYNTDTEELVFTGTTDSYGKLSIILPFGNYEIKQITGVEGYSLMESTQFQINDGCDDLIIWQIKNKEITGSLTVYKKDNKTNDLILDESIFKIYNKDTFEYLKIDNDEEFKTVDGILKIENIPYGTYILEEIVSPNNYYLSDLKVEFKITYQDEEIAIDYYNQKYDGEISILKLDADTLSPLENILFGLYNNTYELIDEAYTNSEGIASFTNLESGTYYIKEILTLDNYELIQDYYKVEVTDGKVNNLTIYNRYKIEVPITGTNEFLIGFNISVVILLLGIILCNYEKD